MIDVSLPTKPIDVGKCFDKVSSEQNGCVDLFVGTVRADNRGQEVKHLIFEAYQKMALSELQKLATDIKQKWPVNHVLIHHRLGKVNVTDVAVVIAISASHRNDSIDATRYAINTLKSTVPIWKKEVYQHGETWLSATP